jgi:hypothetical protein
MDGKAFGEQVAAKALGTLIGATIFTFILGPGPGTALGAGLGGLFGRR